MAYNNRHNDPSNLTQEDINLLLGGSIFSRKLDYTNKAKKILKKYGFCGIISMNVYRTPISSAIDSALNSISFGTWNKQKKKYNYDKLFHLALVVTVQCRDRETVDIIIEKNEVINISRDYKVTNETETFPIKPKKIITLNKLLENTLNNVGERKYFIYDGFTNNCQLFVRYILESNNLYDKKAEGFIFQDISQVLKGIPKYVKRIQKAVTDMASWYSKIVGKGIGGCINCIEAGCLMCGGCSRPNCKKNKEIENCDNDDLNKLTNFVVEMIKNFQN